MKFFNFLSTNKAKGKEDSSSKFNSLAVRGNYSFSSGVNGLSYYKNWIYVAVNHRSNNVAKIQFSLKNKAGDEVQAHDILKLLEEVDYKIIQSFLDLAGNAYLYIAKYNNGTPAKFFPVSPALITPVINKGNTLEVAYYKAGNIQIPAEDIIHFKNFNPNAPYPMAHSGVSVISSISNTVETDEAARIWNFSFFKNSARPDGFLTTDKELSEEEIERIKTDFIAKYGGVENAHKMGFLTGGLRFEGLSSTQKDIDFVSQNGMSRDEILSAFGVPKSEVGLAQDYNRANMEASNYIFMKNTIDPLMLHITKTLQEHFVNRYYGMEELKLSYWSLIPKDETALLNYYNLAVGRWLTVNDIRRKEGEVELEGEGANQIFTTLANVPIANSPTKSLNPNTPDYRGLSQALGDAIKRIEKKEVQVIAKKKADKVIEKGFSYLNDKQKEAHVKNWKNIFLKSEASFEKEIKDYFDKQEKLILDILKKEGKGLYMDIFKAFFSSNDWEKQITVGITLITPKIQEYIMSGADNANQTIGGNEIELNKRVRDFIEERANLFSTSVNETTKNSILDLVSKADEEGASYNDVLNSVKDIFVGASESRVKTIARTEISASANFGAMEAYRQAGVKYVEWQVVNPKDEDCLINMGQVVKIGENFPSGHDNAPVHPNCECTTLAVFE
jgi:HK97 family phage portal protein